MQLRHAGVGESRQLGEVEEGQGGEGGHVRQTIVVQLPGALEVEVSVCAAEEKGTARQVSTHSRRQTTEENTQRVWRAERREEESAQRREQIGGEQRT